MSEDPKPRAAHYRRIAKLIHQPEVEKVVLDAATDWERRADNEEPTSGKQVTADDMSQQGRELIEKAEERFAKADDQRAALKASPEKEVARHQRRVKLAKKAKPEA